MNIQIESPRVYDKNGQQYTMTDCIFDIEAVKKLIAELANARDALATLAQPFFAEEGATVQDENTRLRAQIILLTADLAAAQEAASFHP
jgi:hypothetical protein